MAIAVSSSHCTRCGQPLGLPLGGAFCLACLLSPAQEWLERSGDPQGSALTGVHEWLPGEKIGRYRLEERIGEGGFGIVFRAVQVEPIQREVALKVLKPEMASRDVIARFEGERQALAMMDHPNIATVYDAGATPAGCPYFVMELVKGRPITQYCRDLPLAARLRLFIQACRGVQHAHQKGIIHRDIKPSNVLVLGEGLFSVAKVIDFGVAKALEQPLAEKTIYTAYGQVLGTLQYMSPEQAVSAGADVDTRSDVYSLGVLLYEILTGATPLPAGLVQHNDFAEILRAIRDEITLRPSLVLEKARKTAQPDGSCPFDERPVSAATVRGDLDWIVMKALEKDRNRRYRSPSALNDDLERFLRREAVEARAPTARYRVAKFAQRNSLKLKFVAALATVLAVATVITSWLAVRAIQAEGRTRAALAAAQTAAEENVRQAAVSRRQLIRIHVAGGCELLQDGDYLACMPWFAEALRLFGGGPPHEELSLLEIRRNSASRIAPLASEGPEVVVEERDSRQTRAGAP